MARGLNLTRMVADMITERGKGTVDDILPYLSELGYKRRQVLDALHNARAAGYLVCKTVRLNGERGRVTSGSSMHFPPSVEPGQMYAQLLPKSVRHKGPMVSSVFDLASPKPETAWPEQEGTVYQLLGPWTDPDDLASNDSRKAA